MKLDVDTQMLDWLWTLRSEIGCGHSKEGEFAFDSQKNGDLLWILQRTKIGFGHLKN